MLYDRRPPSTQLSFLSLPKLAYVLAAIVFILMCGIWSFSKPSGATARLVELEKKVKLVRSTELAKGDLRTFPLGSVCGGELDDNLKRQLTNALLGSGLALDTLDIRADGQAGVEHPLLAYTLTLKATGSYEQAITAMEVLAQYRPRLFLDNMALRNNTTFVQLNVEGQFYCRMKKQG